MARAKPKRIWLRRTEGWKMPPNTVKVTRGKGAAGRWGNPYRVDGCTVSDSNGMRWTYDTPEQAIAAAVAGFANWLRALDYLCPGDHRTRANIRKELRGKNLACWCKPGSPCHADVLLEIANG